MPIEMETYDQLPSGWHVLNVMRCQSRSWDWVALAVNVHPDALKHYRCKVAFLYVHPDEYRPEAGRVAREALVRIPGKHRTRDAAWEALKGPMVKIIPDIIWHDFFPPRNKVSSKCAPADQPHNPLEDRPPKPLA
jgi:hypothetical protein